MKHQFNQILYVIAALVVLISTALFFLFPEIMRIAFSIGAAGLAIARLSHHYEGDNFRIKRLYRIQKMAPLALIFASYLMYKPHNQWIPLLLIAAALELYTTFMIERVENQK